MYFGRISAQIGCFPFRIKFKALTVYLNLKMQIWRSGMRQNRLAQMLGMDEALLSKIVNGYRSPSPQVRSKLAQALKRDEKWLFATSGPPRILPTEDSEPQEQDPG